MYLVRIDILGITKNAWYARDAITLAGGYMFNTQTAQTCYKLAHELSVCIICTIMGVGVATHSTIHNFHILQHNTTYTQYNE